MKIFSFNVKGLCDPFKAKRAKEINNYELSMKIFSFNVKGLCDPSKAKKVKEWLRQQGHFDAVVLTKVKCAGESLIQRLTSIDN